MRIEGAAQARRGQVVERNIQRGGRVGGLVWTRRANGRHLMGAKSANDLFPDVAVTIFVSSPRTGQTSKGRRGLRHYPPKVDSSQSMRFKGV